MRTVELTPGIRSSVLGFGCAPILGAVDGATARRALTAALDEGVTHFDLARSYGFGDAEAFVGRFMRGRREQVVFATKFGIVATPRARLLRPLKPLVRWIKKFKGPPRPASDVPPGLPRSDKFHARLPISSAGMLVSVEKSLRALRTDYLDFLLIHEPQEPIEHMVELREAAETLKAQGKIRSWGLAYMRGQHDMHQAILPAFDVLQYNLSPGAAGYMDIKLERAEKANILFSPFRGAHPGASRSEVLQQLATDFPNSVILCSMFNPYHIRANVLSVQ